MNKYNLKRNPSIHIQCLLMTFAIGLSACKKTPIQRPDSSKSIITYPFPSKTPEATPSQNTHEANKKYNQQNNPSQTQRTNKKAQASIQKQQEKLRQQMLAQQKKQQSRVVIKNGADLPAFNRLMKKGVTFYNQQQYSKAMPQFLAAQRLAPQSPAVYQYLGQIALKQGQATKAEILARKGLLVSQSKKYDKSLWQLIYSSAKIRAKSALMQKALQEIAKLK